MITWKQCADLPTRLSEGKTAIINGKVYCGGGATNNHDNDQYIAMTLHKISGPLYHHFLSIGLVWVKSMASW